MSKLFLENDIICIISVDAGGANVLVNLIPKLGAVKMIICKVSGAAKSIFESKGIECSKDTIDELKDKCNVLLTGTSWSSRLEIEAIEIFKKANKRTISFIDHWINYRERFLLNNRMIMPDEIWVGDKYALKLAEDTFKGPYIRLVQNPYWELLIEEAKNIDVSGLPNYDILLINEPLAKHTKLKYGNSKYYGFTEKDVVKKALTKAKQDIVLFRPHPSESEEDYRWIFELRPNIIIEKESTLLSQILRSKFVIGLDSMAMAIAVLLEKQVIASIPKKTYKTVLPFKEIIPIEEWRTS